MSELILLVVRGGSGRLVNGCLSRIAPCYNITETLLRLSRPVPVTTRTISRRLTWWNSLKGLLVQPQTNVSANVLSLGETTCGRLRNSSPPQERNISAASWNKHRSTNLNDEQKIEAAAKVSIFLEQHLGSDSKEAEQCVEAYKGFTLIDPADIPLNYQLCRDAGFSEIVIKQNPGILSYPYEILKVKIQLIKNLNMPVIDDTIPFFKLGVIALRAFSEKLKYETLENGGVNRITYLAQQLQCPTLAICQIVAKYYFMRTVTLAKLEQVLKIMFDFHVSKEDILNDVWAFRYNPELISERLKRVTDAGVFPVKPWMIRCREITLTSRIKKAMHRRSVLGDRGTVTEYLSQRLKCDKKEITELISKNPKIAQVNGPKLKRMVDFLLENGYSVDHVLKAPRMLFHRLETMQERLAELQKYDHKPKSLLVICKSKREFDVYLEMVKLRWIPPNNGE